MPLYRKALKFDPKELENMNFDECYELLLCFRYLQFRNDTTIDSDVLSGHMEEIRKRMAELNGDSAHYKNLI